MATEKDEPRAPRLEPAGCAQTEDRRPWDQIPMELKIERLRREMMGQRGMARHTFQRAQEAHDLAHEHAHGSDGEVLVRARSRRTGAEGLGLNSFDPLA